MNLLEIPTRFNETLRFLQSFNDFVSAQTGGIFKLVFDEAQVPTENLKEARLIIGDNKFSIEYTTDDNTAGLAMPVA